MWIRSLLATVSLFLLALPVHAIHIDLVQTGGTSIGGSGSTGDALSLEVVATLEVGESLLGIFPTLP